MLSSISNSHRPPSGQRRHFPSVFVLLMTSSFLVNCCFTTGTMDAVLASLQRGQSRLRKVPDRRTSPSADDPRNSLMLAIRHGVILKKVRTGSTAHSKHTLFGERGRNPPICDRSETWSNVTSCRAAGGSCSS